MGFFKSLKEKARGEHHEEEHTETNEAAYPSSSSASSYPPQQQQHQPAYAVHSAADEKRRVFGLSSGGGNGGGGNNGGVADQTYEAPLGPPPSHLRSAQETNYAPPPGPPPSYLGRGGGSLRANDRTAADTTDFEPPPGPPPSFLNRGGVGRQQEEPEQYAPPENPPPYHDWTSVPDTALFPPPPAIELDVSPTGNASTAEADMAHDYCERNPLFTPSRPADTIYEAVRSGNVGFIQPARWSGVLEPLKGRRMGGEGKWHGKTKEGCPDCVVLSALPLWFAMMDGAGLGSKKTVYFEVKIVRITKRRGGDESSVAIGFVACPYPGWRLPGWERASLGVHGDDGRRYVNDSWGGRDFTEPFRDGETVGIGMTFEGSGIGNGNPVVEVFFTRGGRLAGKWDLHEELDQNTGGVQGLEGNYDLYGAIGVFGGVEFEAVFERSGWLYQPES